MRRGLSAGIPWRDSGALSSAAKVRRTIRACDQERNEPVHGALVEYHATQTWKRTTGSTTQWTPRPPLIRTVRRQRRRTDHEGQAVLLLRLQRARDTLSNLEDRTVPLDSYRGGTVSYVNNEAESPTEHNTA